MPELPEVETIRRGLAATVLGRRIDAVEAIWRPVLAGPVDGRLLGRRLTGIGRRGKLLVGDLDGGDHLLVHLMMTGQIVVADGGRTLFGGGHPTRSMLEPMPNSTTRAVFRLEGGRAVYFNDQRKFGRIRIADDAALAADPFLTRLGPEPLGAEFTLAAFRARLARHGRAPVKAALLDQTVVAGVGNIYADESLHLARVHPRRLVRSLSAAESRRLHDAVRSTLELAVESGGTSFAAYVNEARGREGYLARARVFRRAGLPCPVCGTAIERVRVAGRGTNVCPRCQRAA
ncbi:MAG TPA: bifunctional DNA-formamidopyrimidine glycosylase/DNA-(apurinic or apyrimidinic site) lyase [Gaiellaceae bacterium]